ncbi:hypothetical protein ACWEJ6_53210 [Nonomuraea sp. NPDC004702]
MDLEPQWNSLPSLVQAAIVGQVGPIHDVQIVPGAPQEFAARLYGRDEVFVKLIPASSPYATWHLQERWAARHLPHWAPVPRMEWSGEVEQYHLTAWQLINDHARPADLTCGSPDVPAVAQALAELGKCGPCPNGARSVVAHLSPMLAGASLALDQPVRLLYGNTGLYEKALDGFEVGMLSGDAMLHGNLSARHLLIKDETVYVVGWSRASSGQAWIDAALLAPHLIAAGHTPEQVNALLWTIPAWHDAPTHLVAGLTVLWTLHHLHEARHAAGRHQISECLADAGHEWLAYLLTRC